MRAAITGIVGLVLAGTAALVFAGGSTAGRAVAVALLGIACVAAVSLTFLAVGRAEDAERAAAAAPKAPPEEPESESEPQDPHPRPALERRRPLPPRRPN